MSIKTFENITDVFLQNLGSIFILLVIVGIVTLIVRHLVREKRRGNVCIGCPNNTGCNAKSCTACQKFSITEKN